jgi:hypothetical protein
MDRFLAKMERSVWSLFSKNGKGCMDGFLAKTRLPVWSLFSKNGKSCMDVFQAGSICCGRTQRAKKCWLMSLRLLGAMRKP